MARIIFQFAWYRVIRFNGFPACLRVKTNGLLHTGAAPRFSECYKAVPNSACLPVKYFAGVIVHRYIGIDPKRVSSTGIRYCSKTLQVLLGNIRSAILQRAYCLFLRWTPWMKLTRNRREKALRRFGSS